MVGKPKFIASQRLLVLKCEPGEEFDYLRPERFRMRRMKQRGDAAEADGEHEQWEGAWEEVGQDDEVGDDDGAERQNRDDIERAVRERQARVRANFLIDPGRRHLCITIGAGIGKTRCAEQIRYLRQAVDPGELALLLDVSHLPYPKDPGTERQLADEYLDLQESTRTALIAAIRREAETEDTEGAASHRRKELMTMKNCSGPVAHSLIHRRIRQGQFTLIVDGLDQIDMENDHSAKAVVAGLQQFLTSYPKARCIVTGRPWAVQRFWKELFGNAKQQRLWAFAQLDEFLDDEIRDYIGKPRKEALELLEADLMAVPRFLERLRSMSPTRLRKLRTGAEVYWESLLPMIEQGCARQQAAIKIDRAMPVLALLAFQMTTDKKSVRVRPGKEFIDCLKAALSRGQKTLLIDDLAREPQTKAFRAQLDSVASLNVGLQHLLMDNQELREIHWQDRTLQAFLAAVWITRYASAADREWLAGNLHVPVDDASEFIYETFIYETWRFVCEMPSDEQVFPDGLSLVFDNDKYTSAMELLFQTATDGQTPIRSTEMIYRAWPTMLRLGGFPLRASFSEQDVLAASSSAQVAAAGEPKDAVMPKYNTTARNAVLRFLGEFPAILRGEQGKAAARIAQEFDASFRPIPGDEQQDCLTFWMSSEESASRGRGETHRSDITAPFRLATDLVTNELYASFDAAHVARLSVHYQVYKRCPTACNWYDAWAVALWLHGRLPSEHEWEYACRAQPFRQDDSRPPEPTLRYDDPSDESLRHHAWFESNSFNKPHPVYELRATNGFGLRGMYGNLWEWTQSWFADQAEKARQPNFRWRRRVLRGGSFRNDADKCRSAYRDGVVPAPSFSYVIGVRVARARKSHPSSLLQPGGEP